jgi:hypothetical protein
VVSRRVPPPPASMVGWMVDDCDVSTDAAEALLCSIDLADPELHPAVLRLAEVVRARIEHRRRQARFMRDALGAYEKTTEKGKET